MTANMRVCFLSTHLLFKLLSMSVPKKGLQVSPSSPILFKPRKPQLDNDHF